MTKRELLARLRALDEDTKSQLKDRIGQIQKARQEADGPSSVTVLLAGVDAVTFHSPDGRVAMEAGGRQWRLTEQEIAAI